MGWSYRAIWFLRFVKVQAGARNCSEPFIVILSAFHLAGKTKHSVLYETKNKRPPVQKRSLLNRVSSCSTGGRGAIRDAAFASASPATLSRLPDRVLFEILRQKLSCNEFPALQSVFSDFSTGLQPAFAFRYPAQHEPGPKESMKTSISKIFDIEDLRYRSIFNIKVLRYRSLNISISRFCEIRDFDIVVDGLRYPSPISDPISKSK
jgi:hypothetical protein